MSIIASTLSFHIPAWYPSVSIHVISFLSNTSVSCQDQNRQEDHTCMRDIGSNAIYNYDIQIIVEYQNAEKSQLFHELK
jgi:hypothetical protein